MKRREFLGVLGGAAATWPVVARAQDRSVPVIGFLSPTTSAAAVRLYRPLWAGLRELGHIDGRNIRLERRYAEGVLTRLPALAAELVALKPDLIIAGSTPSTLAAHGATQTIPIVMITLLDPVALGVVKSIARPGGNVTGIWTFAGDDALVGKRIGLLKKVVPNLSRIAVMIASGDTASETTLKLLPTATHALGVTYKVFEIQTSAEIDGAFALASRDGLQGMFIDQSPLFLAHKGEVAAAAARVGLPAVYGYRDHAEAGGLMSYGSSLADAYQQVARLVDKVLKGAKPANLLVEQAAKFELIVNNKTAKALGLKISKSFLLRADDVIE